MLNPLPSMVLPKPSIEALRYILLNYKKENGRLHGLFLCAYMHKAGMDSHVILGSCLICLLVELGHVHKAHQVFNRLVYKSASSWSFLIMGYVNSGEPHHALSLYHYMPQNGSVCLDGHTFVELLNSCAKLQDLRKGLDIHAHIARLGLVKMDIFVGSALVDMYCKCGILDYAQQVFDELPVRNVISWNSLIAGYADRGHGRLALICYENMQLEGFSPNAITYVCSLKACGIMNDIDKGHEIHAEIEQKGFLLTNCFVGSALVDMYVKCALILCAQQVFHKLLVRDVVLWTALIAGYVEHGKAKEALDYFDQMQLEGFFPNAFTYVCSLKACSIIGDIERSQEIHAEIERKGLLERNLHIGSVLVDIYAKCGFLAKALQLLKRLPARDVVSWTALIAGYVEHGLAEEALECYQQMQLEGVHADANTFVCSLKACGILKAPNKGAELHAEIERKGLVEEDLVVGNTLIDMYAKCGSLAKAQEVFDMLPVKDVISWNSLVAGYTEHGQSEDALQCYEQMLLEGISPDAISFVCCLKACGTMQAIGMGLELHGEVERNGLLERNASIGSTLVDMYAKCGLLSKAQQVFDKLSIRDVVSWNTLIAGYVEQARGDDALQCFEKMQSEGVYPDDVTLVCSLKACGQSRALYKGQEIHSEIDRKSSLQRNPAVGSALVNMYIDCGLLTKAREMFDRLPFRDAVLWNVLITGYAEHGHGEEALKCYEQMHQDGLPLDLVTFICSLKSCRCVGAIDKSSDIHAEIERQQVLERDLMVGNTLVRMYAEHGSLAIAQQVFDNLLVRDVATWNALIAGYAENGYGEKGLQCFDQMLIEGVLPNSDTFILSSKACGYLGATERGYEIHAEIEKRGLQEDLFVGSALVDMYAKCGLLASAHAVFDKLSVRDVVLWNVLIAGYAEHEYQKGALDLMKHMQRESISPTAATFVFCLQACGSMGAIAEVREIHGEIEKQGLLESDLVVGNTLVDFYSKCGLLSTAQKVFEKLPVRDIVSWNALIAGYAQLGESEDVFGVFNQLLEEGARPDATTFVIVLNACSRACLVDRSEMYFDAMRKFYGIIPMFEHHACVLDLFARAGQLSKAVAMIKNMPLCDNLVAWRTVLSACKKWGNIHVGREAFEHAMFLDKNDAASYVLMSHVYVDTVMQEAKNGFESSKLRKQTRRNPGHYQVTVNAVEACLGEDTHVCNQGFLSEIRQSFPHNEESMCLEPVLSG